TKGKLKTNKECWWWNDSVKTAIKDKKEAFKRWSTCTIEEDKDRMLHEYRDAKKIAKRKVAKAQDQGKEKLYHELCENTTEGSQKLYKLAAQRREKAKSIRNPKYINGSDGTLKIKEKDICDRWKEYYTILLNEEFPRKDHVPELKRYGPIQEITSSEVNIAVKSMKKNKAVGPDGIPSELWKACNEDGIEWLTLLLNKIIMGDLLPNRMRNSFTLPFFKNKGDSRDCGNYRGISLLSHTMKIYERVIENRLRKIINIHENQCGFVSGKSTMDAIQTVRIIVEKYRDAKKDLHMVFIDMEKAFDRVPRTLIYESLRSHDVPEEYVRLIMDMYHNTTKQIRCTSGISSKFNIKVGVHQGSVLSPLLFIIIMNHLTSQKMDDLLKILLFADDIVMVAENKIMLENTLETWRQLLEDNGLKISRTKTEYLYLPFKENNENPDDIIQPIIKLQGEDLPICENFKYLGSFISKDGTCKADVDSRVQIGWCKFKSLTGVLCDRKLPVKLKGKIYKTVIRPALIYGTEAWTMYETFNKKKETTEMRMLRMSTGVSLMDRIQSKYIRGSMGVTTISKKIEEKQLRWYGHIRRRPEDHMVVKAMKLNVAQQHRTGRGRPKHNWIRQQEVRLERSDISEADIPNRRTYNLRTRRADPRSH
ncbi:hypothetical protein WDU94_015584, partial [Cyamophila willieti]